MRQPTTDTTVRRRKCVCRVVAASALSTILSFQCSLSAANAQSRDLPPVDLKPAIADPRHPNAIPSTSAPVLTIDQAVASAVKKYPQLQVRIQQARAAEARILLTREQEYMPKALSNWQEVAGSHNKLTQVLFADPVLTMVTGPGRPYQTWHGRFFSANGFLLDWSPLDFGLHKARINATKAEYHQAQTNIAVTELDIAVGAANAFLNLVVSQQQVRAAQANVNRMQVVLQVVNDLVANGLRPGVDASLAEGELAETRNVLISAEERELEARAALAHAIGEAGTEVNIDPVPVQEKEGPPVLTISLPDFNAHPLSVAEKSMIGTLLAQKTVLSRSVYPTFRFVGGFNLRGASLDLAARNTAKNVIGLWPAVYNWNVGIIANWNFLDWIPIHQQKVIQDRLILAQQAQYTQIIQNLKEQDQKSRAMLEGAIKLAQNMPLLVKAAKDAELRARTRYQTGLGTIEEVADAERMLARAEVQNAVAKIGVWKALLAMANTRGSVTPFLNQIAAARASLKM